jgi:hypothetical protein
MEGRSGIRQKRHRRDQKFVAFMRLQDADRQKVATLRFRKLRQAHARWAEKGRDPVDLAYSPLRIA